MTHTGSNRRGATRDTHGTRSRGHALGVYFLCDYCPPGSPTWRVSADQTVIDAQTAHRATHPLSLRVAIEELTLAAAAEGSGTYTQALRSP
jgi:hypothetical protein